MRRGEDEARWDDSWHVAQLLTLGGFPTPRIVPGVGTIYVDLAGKPWMGRQGEVRPRPAPLPPQAQAWRCSEAEQRLRVSILTMIAAGSLTSREICTRTGELSLTVWKHLQYLEKQGLIARAPGQTGLLVSFDATAEGVTEAARMARL